ESEEVVYGTLSPIKSLNPIWNNFVYWYELFNLTKKLNNTKDKLSLLFKPLWLKNNYDKLNINMNELFNSKDFNSKFNPQITNQLTIYSLVHFVLILLFSVPLLEYKGQLLSPYIIANVSFVVLSLSSIGWILENNKNALKFEQFRLALIISYALISPFNLTIKIFIITTYLISLFFLNLNKEISLD
ncbi:MAG: hypothetical protein ACK4IX_14425, partial [Candidatus Sericytochromatia bacterium]